jgi:hypothetical protein
MPLQPISRPCEVMKVPLQGRLFDMEIGQQFPLQLKLFAKQYLLAYNIELSKRSGNMYTGLMVALPQIPVLFMVFGIVAPDLPPVSRTGGLDN